MGEPMIRIAIADDHRLFADGLRNAFDAVPDMRVVVVAGSADELIEGLGRQPAEVALVDLEMPGGGIEAIRRLGDSTASIVVSMHVTPTSIRDARLAGASAVFTKSVPLGDLAAAVRSVAAGHRLIDLEAPDLGAELDRNRSPSLDPGAASLTKREIEILVLLSQGVSATDEISERLFISQKTVKNHLASIFQKLAVADRTQAAVEAIRLGLAKPN
jgi:two-component system, NarL family, response regulator DegU